MSSGEPMSSERLAEIEQRANNLEEVYQAGDGQGGFRGLGYRDVHSVTLAYHTDVPALLAEVERLRAREAALVGMLAKLISDADATYVDVHPYAGVGHTKIIGPFPASLEQARALLASTAAAGEPHEQASPQPDNFWPSCPSCGAELKLSYQPHSDLYSCTCGWHGNTGTLSSSDGEQPPDPTHKPGEA